MNNQEKNTYVRSQILNTMLRMLKTNDFDSITISRLVAAAGVGRASFYRNYQTKEDVLRCEAERLNEELGEIRKGDDPNDIRMLLIRTIDFYKEHSEYYLTLYNAGLKNVIEDSIVRKDTISTELPSPIAYVISGFSYLIYGWVIEWIARGMKETSQELIVLFESSQKTPYKN